MIDLADIERSLEDLLPAAETRPVALSQAMRWAVLNGGKRVRPRLCLAAAEAAGGGEADALMPACAIELLHSYTLVHDDLPAMDNDELRRGRASVWTKFGEATAILAGDRLQALAFAVAARAPRNATAVVATLAVAAEAVVSGQVEDIAATERLAAARGRVSEDDLLAVFEGKTAALFVAAAEMGALAAGADAATVARLGEYARHLGLAFQYEDDLLDGDDGAFSSISVLGIVEVKQRVADHTAAALKALEGLPGNTEFLVELANSLAIRRV